MSDKLSTWIVCLCLMGLPNLYARAGHDYVVNSQNVLVVNIFGEEDLSQTVQVSADGFISCPLVGKVKVAGLTVTEIEEKLTKLFQEYLINPYVSVLIKGYSSFYVYGQVARPGIYKLEGDVSLLEAIALAGGLTRLANAGNITVIRIDDKGQKGLLKIKIDEITKKANKNQDVLIRPNDIIVVSESLF